MNPNPLDGIDDENIGVPRPVTPLLSDEQQTVADAVNASLSDFDSYFSSAIADVESEVNAELSSVRQIVDAHIGAIDVAVSDAESQTLRTMETLYTRIMRDVGAGENEMTYAGVAYPWDTDTMRNDLADETGEAIITRLMGGEPSYEASIPVDPGTLPAAVVGGAMPVPGVVPSDTSPIAPGESPLTVEPWPDEPPADTAPIPVTAPVVAPSDSGECGCGCPPPDVHVTVNVPPLTAPVAVNLPPMPPPMSPPASPMPPPPPPGNAVPGLGGAMFTPSGEPVLELPPTPVVTPYPANPADDILALMPTPKPPPPPPALAGLPFDNYKFCATLKGWKEGVRNAPGFVGWESAYDAVSAGNIGRSMSAVIQGMSATVVGENPAAIRAATDRAYATAGDWFGGASLAADVLGFTPARILFDRDQAWWLMTRIAAARKAASDSGYPTEGLVQSHVYALNSLSPQAIPGQGELDFLLAQSYLTVTDWECATRMLGNQPSLRKDLIHGLKPHPSAIEVQLLKQRGELNDEQYSELMRRAGSPDVWSRSWWESLAKFVPGPADLVRFMVRDAFDPNAVNAGKLDKDFEAKFYGQGGRFNPGPAAKWAQAQGMTEDQFRFFWYSHWEYPSNTALYEMLHRLRPDRPEVAEWVRVKELHDKGVLKGEAPKPPAVVTRDDVRKVVEINDMAPAWVDALLDISYHPVTRTDAIDAYQAGLWTEEQLLNAMLDNGYHPRDAKQLVDIQRAKKARRVSNVAGVWSVRRVVSAYKDGAIDNLKATQLLTPLLTDPQQIRDTLAAADDEVKAESMRRWISYERRAYFHGAKDAPTTVRDLVLLGITPSRADELVTMWRADRDGRFREPSTRNVVTWLKLGIITADDASTRLKRMGYEDADIRRLIHEGAILWQERIEGKIEKARGKIEKFFETQAKLKKASEKEIKDAMKEAEKRQEKLKKEYEKMLKELEDRGVE